MAQQYYVTLMKLPSATKLRRLCFYTCLSVHKGESASVHAGIPPPLPEQTAPGTRHPLRAGILPGAGNPPGAGTPQSRQSRDQTHPLSRPPTPDETSPRNQTPPKQTARILLEYILVFYFCHTEPFSGTKIKYISCVKSLKFAPVTRRVCDDFNLLFIFLYCSALVV